ncbi:MAG: hypothetical protein DWQ06_10320 [Calditrichaeota bacterium]|nr:MAG: hypothetical protein DWQ06_10320 [Calditrichota bacterium]
MSNKSNLQNRREALKRMGLAVAGIAAAPVVTKLTGTDEFFSFSAFAGPKTKYKGKAGFKGVTLSGRITFSGTVPKPIMKDITADFDVAGKAPRVWEALNVGTGNGVKDLVVFIEEAKTGKKFSGKETILDHKGAVMIPRVDVIELAKVSGGKMMVYNNDPVLHQVRAVNEKGKQIKNLALPTKGMKLPFKTKKPGTLECTCDPHPWERSFRLAAQNPYYAITSEDGSFEIYDLADGTYTLKVWGEGIKEASGKVVKQITVAGGAVTANLELTKADLTDALQKNA